MPSTLQAGAGRKRRDANYDPEAAVSDAESDEASAGRQLPRDFRPLAGIGALRSAPPRAHAAALAVDRGTALAGGQPDNAALSLALLCMAVCPSTDANAGQSFWHSVSDRASGIALGAVMPETSAAAAAGAAAAPVADPCLLWTLD